MSVRSDVTVDFTTSPRVITIASPSVAIIGQDLVDTLRVIEKNILNLIYPKLLDAEGKSDLGDGFFTGFTVKLQNALIAFAARSGPSTIQCDVSQCDLVASDSVGARMSPIAPTAFTQVVIRQSTSPALVTAGSAVTSQDKADIVNQMWDAARSGHVTVGSFGETLDAKMSSRSSQSRPQRGTALPNLTFVMFDSITRSPKTGLSVAGQVSKDGAAFAGIAGAPVEIGQGVYRASLNATEMTADMVTALFTGAGAEPQVVTMVTAP